MTLLRPFAALSGFANRIYFILGASFLFLLLSCTSVYADDTVTPTPPQNETTTSDPSVNSEVEPAPVVVETITPGGDDTSYRLPLTTVVIFNGVEYTDVYATTNSVITFGQADGTYWDYPTTPSISI